MLNKKYLFGTTVFHIISDIALKDDERFEAFLIDDQVKEDYLFEICPIEDESHVDIKRNGNVFKVFIRKSLISEITISNLFSVADVAKLLPERNEFVLHASYIVYQDKAILFCAPSGTGKSTQADFWHQKHNTITVNEDRVIIFVKDGIYYAGGCWATGKAHVCLNRSVPIHRIILLEQGNKNKVIPLSSAEKFKRMIAECSFDSENLEMQNRMISNVLNLIESVTVIGYECVNDSSSVEELEKYL